MKQVPSDRLIIESWHKNAAPWVDAVRQGKIKSRIEVTDRAILESIRSFSPASVLDLGCGEGWLCRELVNDGIGVLGIDAVQGLVDAAGKYGPGRYYCMEYEDVSRKTLTETFDLIVCNFSLLGKQTVEHVFRQAPSLLNEHGMLVVQTLHPQYCDTSEAYRDGWRKGSWRGFGDEFTDPAPWYFRTLASWQQLYAENGFRTLKISEPKPEGTEIPVSLLMTGSLSMFTGSDTRMTSTDT